MTLITRLVAAIIFNYTRSKRLLILISEARLNVGHLSPLDVITNRLSNILILIALNLVTDGQILIDSELRFGKVGFTIVVLLKDRFC